MLREVQEEVLLEALARAAQGYVAPAPGTTVSTSPITISVPTVAELLGISQKHAWSFVMKGELRSYQLGRRRVVAIADLYAFLKTKAAEVRPAPSCSQSLAGRHAGRPAGGHAGGSGEPVHVDDDDEENL
jgi:excisionase family DNA binding protein